MIDRDISDKILQDEVVQYISARHHITASCLVAHLSDLELEENEIQIIQDLIRMYE